MPNRNSTLNPATLGMTLPEFEVYQIICKREKDGLTIKSSDVADDWGRDRSHAYRVMKSLVKLGYIEKYSPHYYRLTNNTERKKS